MKTPRWVLAYAERMQQALGLGAWQLTFEMCDQPNPDVPASDATTYANPRYLEALIKLRPSCMKRETNAGKVLLIHELLHVVDSQKSRVMEQLVHAHVPEELQPHIFEMLVDADERRVILLSRALFYAFEPSPPKRKKRR